MLPQVLEDYYRVSDFNSLVNLFSKYLVKMPELANPMITGWL